MPAIDFPNSPAVNDEFTAGTTIYKWDGTAWRVKQSTLAASVYSDSNPLMNSSASAGTSALVSRSDHIHPTDTSRAPLESPSFTGTVSFSAATVTGIDLLPSQSGNSGKYLTTNGSSTSWATVDALPLQSGNSGKYLTTNGTSASWATLDLSLYLTSAAAASTYEPIISSGTTSQYLRGDKTWQTLDKTAVGLSNVENTALSTWAGSTNITTLGTVTTVTSPTAAGSSGVRKITISTSAATGGADGDIWITYV